MIEQIICADALEGLAQLEPSSVDMCVTSPPYYGLRDYGADGQIGLEDTPEAYIERLIEVFRAVRRVLRDDGTLWVNIGDSYNGGGIGGGVSKGSTLCGTSNRERQGQDRKTLRVAELKPKDMIGIPWLLAFALRADGWYLRNDIIWHKPNVMPESVTDRCTTSYEHIFLLAKSERYFFNNGAIREPHSREWWSESVGPAYMTSQDGRNDGGKRQGNGNPDGRNKRDVWTVATRPYNGAHFATFPPDLIRPCILAGSRPGSVVLDPFFGAGTTGLVAMEEQRGYIGIELNQEYVALARHRLDTAVIQYNMFSAENDNAAMEQTVTAEVTTKRRMTRRRDSDIMAP